MANVNINSKVSDQFFRYKMPKLIAKVEGKGNGIKTVIVNMPEIAKALNRPPMYPTKYFGCVLGAQVNFDSKSERFIVNGAHDPEKLQDLLDGFIQKYVLCHSCENPETVLSVSKKKEIIGTSCMACGHSGTISALNDRVGAYILKNPPPKQTAGTAGAANSSTTESADKKSKSGKSKSSKRSSNDNSTNPSNTDDCNNIAGKEEDEDWGEETDESAVRRRMEELSAGAKSLMLNDDLEKKPNERLQIFYEFVEEKAKTTDLTLGENQKVIKSEAERLDLSDKAVIVLCEVLLNENLLEKVKVYKNLFLRFTHQNNKAQRYLLRGLELIINSKKDILLPKVPIILNMFYDLEIIVEDVFLEWYAKGQKKTSKSDEKSVEIIDKATPFIKWLNEASEESGDEDDEDDKVDIDFDDRIVGDAIKVEEENKDSNSAKVVGKQPASTLKSGPGAKVLVEEEEIDIDAI